MIKNSLSIQNGLYLIIDPASMELQLLLQKVESALKGGVSAIQILNNFKPNTCKVLIIDSVTILAHRFSVPVLMNQDLTEIERVNGIHFEEIPDNFESIRPTIPSDAIVGITCGNNFDKIEWAVRHNLDYISFGAVFPTDSIDSYSIVSLETVRKARIYTDMPIFLCGGITLDNIEQLGNVGFDGIAVISGIMSAESPQESACSYKTAIEKIKKTRKIEAFA